MCGILGYKRSTGAECPLDLQKLSHRGPDASGTFESETGTFALGHTRLAIVGLNAASNQPFHSANGRYVLVYNGELYNYKELANKHALSLRTNSDTEVIAELYARLGPAFLHELNGMFAGAIYDRQKDELFLFRDRLGIKPLYYFHSGEHFAFGSELPALLNMLPTPEVNQDSIANFLHLGYIPEPHTLYKNISKFPAGSYAVYRRNALTTTTYWKAEDHIAREVHSNEAVVLKETEELLRDSVRLRLMADVPFGTFLSGGADSGLISALAADISPKPIHTFNVSFEDAQFDETQFAREMATRIGAVHHNILVSKKEVLSNLEEGLKLIGEPFADSGVFAMMAVSKFAASHIKMALSGDGGDELFMGYVGYKWTTRLSRPQIYAWRGSIAKLLRLTGRHKLKRAANVFDFRKKDSVFSHIFSQEQNLFSAAEVERIFGRPPESYQPLPHPGRKLTPAEEQAFFDLTHYLKDDLLVKVDRASMRYGLEVRVPFLDHRLVAYSLNIDPALKTKNGETKYLIKKILEKYYPHHLVYRKKWGFSIPLENWLKNSPELSAMRFSDPALQIPFEHLWYRYQHQDESGYLYNRLYALKCLAVHIS